MSQRGRAKPLKLVGRRTNLSRKRANEHASQWHHQVPVVAIGRLCQLYSVVAKAKRFALATTNRLARARARIEMYVAQACVGLIAVSHCGWLTALACCISCAFARFEIINAKMEPP